MQLIKPMLVRLQIGEQKHFPEHPSLTKEEMDRLLTPKTTFSGENIIFAAFDPNGEEVGFCWCVLFDPGTGLEGEIAELYVNPQTRGQGIAQELLENAKKLFADRETTLVHVWTRPENQVAANLYRKMGFMDTRQLVLTWYPNTD